MSRWYAYMQGAGHMAARPLAYACNICIRHVTWHVRHGYGSWQAPADAIEICARIIDEFRNYKYNIRLRFAKLVLQSQWGMGMAH